MTRSDDTREFMTPVPMVLFCPACGLQHIDAPDPEGEAHAYADGRETRWQNPPHRSHLCAGCGHIWRPADAPTTGVQEIETRGANDDLPVIRFRSGPVEVG